MPGYATPTRRSSGSNTGVIVGVLVGVGVLLCLCCGVAYWAVDSGSLEEMAAQNPNYRSQCSNNLKAIGLGMHNYHDAYKEFPAAVLTDEDDRPMRSWRVAILPFIEQAALHDRYDYNEPWDGPHNQELADVVLEAYRCPSEMDPDSTDTSYLMIAGEGSIGGLPNEGVRIAKVTDGTSNTVMVVEVTNSGIHWMEPRDLDMGQMSMQINDPSGSAIRSRHGEGAHVLLADGSVRFLGNEADPETVRALCTRAGGEAVSGNF